MRVALAAVLFAQPDLLLLDEPTNYLDLEGVIWLESFIAKYEHMVLVISHDRTLLNRSVNGILTTDCGLTYYAGCYDQFETERRMKLEPRRWCDESKTPSANIFRPSLLDSDTTSIEGQRLNRVSNSLKKCYFSCIRWRCFGAIFSSPEPLPSPLLILDQVTVGYGGTAVLRKLDLRLDADDRIALLGANGEGKSTLSKLLADKPLFGNVQRAPKLRVGFFAQGST